MQGKQLILGLLCLSMPALAERPVEPFAADSVPAARYSSYRRVAYYAPVRDGTKLAITVYQPVGAGGGERFPTLLWYHPGHRESMDLASGVIRPTMSATDISFFTGQGYAVAVAEMRGSGASFGV
ncbi:MAG: hypothetical protein RLZZ427_1366, partial [Pseudomonadota bacterium]